MPVDLNTLDDAFFDDGGEDTGAEPKRGAEPWRVLVVDDDVAVHHATSYALDGTMFEDRPVALSFASSAAEAREILSDGASFAVIFVDVVMETDLAGLGLVRWIREERDDRLTRLVLRTGQPGQAPERKVIVDYEIDDYKTKTELTHDKLYVTLISSLRSFRNLDAIERSRQGLRRVITASANLFDRHSFNEFASGVLDQLSAILTRNQARLLFVQDSDTPDLVAASDAEPAPEGANLPEEVLAPIRRAFAERHTIENATSLSIYLGGGTNRPYVLHVASHRGLDDIDRELLDLYCHRISAGFQAAELFDELHAAHAATIEVMAKIVEYRDDSTGAHVMRVGGMAERTARLLHRRGHAEVDERLVGLIRYGAMLHDIGKVAIPDAILGKPGPLSDNERAVMQTHAETGAKILDEAARTAETSPYLTVARAIAANHHERWDGQGYPAGAAGRDIPVEARIVSICDVYDALIGRRPYKDPWPPDKARAFIAERAGSQFDPEAVDAFLAALDDGAA